MDLDHLERHMDFVRKLVFEDYLKQGTVVVANSFEENKMDLQMD